MSDQPSLSTPRLVLRPFRVTDAADVQRLAGDAAVADTTLSIPHPYPDGAAEAWIATHAEAWRDGREAVFAITLRGTGELAGAIGCIINRTHDRGEFGYWLGREYWNRGIATEALRTLIPWTFATFNLHRLQAGHFARNPASGRVMEKAGMLREGRHRGRVKRNGRYEDVVEYAILRPDLERPN